MPRKFRVVTLHSANLLELMGMTKCPLFRNPTQVPLEIGMALYNFAGGPFAGGCPPPYGSGRPIGAEAPSGRCLCEWCAAVRGVVWSVSGGLTQSQNWLPRSILELDCHGNVTGDTTTSLF